MSGADPLLIFQPDRPAVMNIGIEFHKYISQTHKYCGPVGAKYLSLNILVDVHSICPSLPALALFQHIFELFGNSE